MVNKALKDPDYASKFNGGGRVILTVNLKKLGINVEGIDQVELVFLKEKGLSNIYSLKTAYPKEGWAVEMFIPGRGGWQ